jgi:hypothetical protein
MNNKNKKDSINIDASGLLRRFDITGPSGVPDGKITESDLKFILDEPAKKSEFRKALFDYQKELTEKINNPEVDAIASKGYGLEYFHVAQLLIVIDTNKNTDEIAKEISQFIYLSQYINFDVFNSVFKK